MVTDPSAAARQPARAATAPTRVVFFIFLVANIGGALTPLGDPPLFLGFLHGVPFFWTFGLWKQMLFVARTGARGLPGASTSCAGGARTPACARRRRGRRASRSASRARTTCSSSPACSPASSSRASGTGPEVDILGVPPASRRTSLATPSCSPCCALSWWTTSRAVREANEYSWAPIREVAILFAGIFVTIIPALAMLRVGEQGGMAVVVGGGPRAGALLLGQRHAVVVPRQRAHLPRVPHRRRSAGCSPACRIRGRRAG